MTEFESWCKPIIDQINVPVTIEYGAIDTGYSHLLVVENGQIKSIGSFAYNFYYYHEIQNDGIKIKLGVEAEKYRTGQRNTPPSLYFNNTQIVI